MREPSPDDISAPKAKRPPPLQSRAHRTRDALLSAVEDIVAADGTQAVTTTRVAQATGVAVGTVYRYFPDRDALLLAAYDATVARITADCAARLAALPGETPPSHAARLLLDIYLEAALAVPAHAALLVAMRAIRPIAADQEGGDRAGISARLFQPFMQKFLPQAAPDALRLHFAEVLVATMVDLYLLADDGEKRRLKQELDAHVDLVMRRLAE